MNWRGVAFVVALTAALQAQQHPYLYITWIGPDGKEFSGREGSLPATNRDRFRLQVCLKARIVADRFEPLEIRALNQHPDYFRAAPWSERDALD